MIRKNVHLLALIKKAAKDAKRKVGYYDLDYTDYRDLLDQADSDDDKISAKAEKELDKALKETTVKVEIIHEDCYDDSEDGLVEYNSETDKFQPCEKGNGDTLYIECYLDDPLHISSENISFELNKNDLIKLYNMTDDEVYNLFKQRFEDELESYIDDVMFDY